MKLTFELRSLFCCLLEEDEQKRRSIELTLSKKQTE